MPRNTVLRLTLAAAAVAAACAAHAQTVQPEEKTKPEPKQGPMQKVEVKGSTEAYDPRRDDTASKIVISNEEIVRYGDQSISDVLKRVPGVTVGGGGRGGGDIRMRGLGSGYTQILLNGERAPAGFSIDSLSPDVIERIEVLRAASAEFSTQSIAGTINIVLKKAIKTGQRELKLSAGKSHEQFTPFASLQVSDKVGQMSYSIGANLFKGIFDRQSPVHETLVDPSGALQMQRDTRQTDHGRPQGVNISPRLNWNLAGGDTLTSQSFINFNRFDGASDAVIDTPVGKRPTYQVMDTDFSNHNAFVRTDLNWVHKLAGGGKLDTKIGLNALRNTGYWHQFGYDLGALRRDSTVLSKTTEHGFSSTGKYSTPLIPDHALAMGWDGGIAWRDDSRIQRDVNLPGSHPENSDEGYDAKVSRMAFYGQDEWNITPRWSMYAGLRWEGLFTESEGSTFERIKQNNSVWSPIAQTLYKLPNSKDQLRLALTRTYKAPPASNLIPRRFTSSNNSQTDPDRRGNPDLKPELASGIDASYEHYWAQNALLSASASMRRISGYTRQGVVKEGDRWVSMPVNEGRATTRSIELEAKFPLSAIMSDAPSVDLRASANRNWSKVDSVPGPDNRLDQQVPFSATLAADYKSKDGKLTLGSSYAFKNGGHVRISDKQSAYQSVRRDLEAYALWKFDPKLQLRVAVSNLLTQDFISDSAYTDDSGTLRRTAVLPGYVTTRATLEMRF
ncbi:TonB-dependent receptor plug domain-containing protein [Massilia endophytica]|uniref:TonB-dependent receptor plug domain-containing protein n=1 Tax=Massilia endophytica TaxID=2899220 RepID=UPI001E39E56F|nr:TonB-dependent receptor [Massilia endophytica]UGQ48283.1 TonB-dependent receptor [Massilia endophytica]